MGLRAFSLAAGTRLSKANECPSAAGNRRNGLNFTAPPANALDLLTLWADKATVPILGVMLVLPMLLVLHPQNGGCSIVGFRAQ